MAIGSTVTTDKKDVSSKRGNGVDIEAKLEKLSRYILDANS